MADMTQLTGAYAAAWLPWIMIPMIFYILPFPVFAIIFLGCIPVLQDLG
ncbi:MAG: photosystem I reaction center subunit VIII [Leptolyngbya sp. DLM2.Bin27]|nr:MAG: photosystem I reaction center subunit VIII [Leptolyngbya sp. DLM2.Bin27]